jgi:Ca2+/Na+ antiporter
MWGITFDGFTIWRVFGVILFAALIALAILLTLPRSKNRRGNLVLGITIIWLLMLVFTGDVLYRWQLIVGLLPMLMVGYQLFFLWLYHPKEIAKQGPEKDRPPTGPDNPKAATGTGQTEAPQDAEPEPVTVFDKADRLSMQSFKRAQDAINSNFSVRTLLIRYGLPAVLLGATGTVIIDLLIEPGTYFSLAHFVSEETAKQVLLGVKLGAVGAYVYVLLELGRRTFRHDITAGLAMWCWVTLVLGPLLAATVAFLWRIKTEPADSGWWGAGVVLFFAGFAPRRVIAAIEQAAAQLLKIGSPTTFAQTRLIPLSQLRGISPQIEERLGEEGIFDVNALSATEPVRLVRNTSFDMRQILNWIDEAILIVTLPRGWEGLEEAGVTGAISLAWYYHKIIDPATGRVLDPIPDEISALATKAKLDAPMHLVSTIERLYENTQVQYILALYRYFTEYAVGD